MIEKVCSCCGKRFYVSHGVRDYLYKIHYKSKDPKGKVTESTKYYCGYTCWIRGRDEKFSKSRIKSKTI